MEDCSMDAVDLDRVWIGVAAQVWHRGPGRVERLAGRLLRSPGLAKALVTTPSLLLPWLVATVFALAAGALTTLSTGQPAIALVAPVVAAAGIAYAYGPGVDPAWELSRSMAISDRMVLLVRALAVFALDSVLGLAAAGLSASAAHVVFGWLIPMTAVSALALAVATVARSANAGVGAAVAAWVGTLLTTQSATGGVDAAFRISTLTYAYLAVAVCGAAATIFATRTSQGTA